MDMRCAFEGRGVARGIEGVKVTGAAISHLPEHDSTERIELLD